MAQGLSASFFIDPTARDRMLKGLDPIGATLELGDAISAYEAGRATWLPATS
jgi:3-isopropylmalate/(R)-2-methylmalate dehydratase small subunit